MSTTCTKYYSMNYHKDATSKCGVCTLCELEITVSEFELKLKTRPTAIKKWEYVLGIPNKPSVLSKWSALLE
jgi:hypothetical protein